jgi:hypothetical protein
VLKNNGITGGYFFVALHRQNVFFDDLPVFLDCIAAFTFKNAYDILRITRFRRLQNEL